MKALIFVRTSTEKQSTDDQKRELVEFCKSEGYDDIVCVERQGASAAKVDDEYREMVAEVKEKIESDPEIKCFAVWHLNRLARTEEMWVGLKTFFVKHQVQIICKNPYLKLLTPDGKVDQGIELAMGLLAILAKQDQEERVAKFKRAKEGMSRKGMYTGGHTIPFGYKVVDGYFVEDEVTGKIVREIFSLYSTGEWSTYTLGKEMKDRGYASGALGRILRFEGYCGGRYPAIVPRELFEKCRKVRENNKMDIKKNNIPLGAKLVRCPVCGAACTSNSKHYACCRKYICGNRFNLSRGVADNLLWRTAFGLHIRYLMGLDDSKKDEMERELAAIEEKIESGRKKVEELGRKKERIIESYVDGVITRKDRDTRLLKVEDDVRDHLDTISLLQGKREGILGIFEKKPKDTLEAFVNSLDMMDSEDKYQVIHKHIESLVAKPESYGVRDRRSKRENAVRIVIKDIYGGENTYMYFPMKYQGHNLYLVDEGKMVPDSLDADPTYLYWL